MPAHASDSSKKDKNPRTDIDAEYGSASGAVAAVQYTDDDKKLMAMGYKPELRRKFSYLSAFGQSWGSQGLAPAIVGSLVFALGPGGSVASVWTWLVGCGLLIPAALALGELSSSMPTSGGVYYWAAKLTPVKYRRLF